ncbi:putative serine/threonine protein kinase [Streptomyces avermitilis MA-4680 = NBRC 14893]|uniref:Serine/threonine protein kinase n=1 Tax=Streptomyces avermitilis (strain ATCC 31267 / DSM 46492 / JCM 5070 / NBRC 14893 / NCIMB 12804 / NRRL 8165 / MA-4680) TaxID=227882 RepID=Q81ZX3_STRAW|nr:MULTISPECIES: serine/threonine-protein kinase [Streptomyces]MYT00405.1 protein kinase [Streptomyces sp. SID5469]BAC72534.1 putative serine/threonine protein kinase [Streptomyces avermitilis MA-4680 = NBRC 14893]
MQPLEVGEPTVVGPYRLLGRLGSGGMGRVYLGRSTGGRTVAVKIVHPHFALDEEFRARFRREVEAARRVGGAWTAPVLDADPEASVPWVATGYAAGPSLAAAVTDGGPLPTHSVRALGAGLAEALSAVHGLGLVHRDVKPSNVLLTLDGPLLIDFGIARATDGTASLTSTGVSVGSPGYMSPEQILGKGIAGAADVFSLGAVLAYAGTGAPPFPGDSSASLLYKVVHEEPELGSLEGELRELVAHCLAKDPDGRPGPAEVAERLAPQGAARLVTGGWLPGPLVEQVSRSAVQLLNLDVAGAAEAVPSGPVEFSTPSVRPPTGVFGPPPDLATPAYMPAPRPAEAQPRPEPQPQPQPQPQSQPPAQPQDAVPGVPLAVAPESGPPGRVSVSVAATSAPGTGGRGRRVSCTVALAVAGALATVTVGSAFLFGLLEGGDSSGGDSSGSADSPPAATASASRSDPGDGADGAVPKSYLGTWEGDALALGGTLPAGTFRVTIGEAAVGKEIGTFRSTDQLGGTCDDVLLLKKATAQQLVATSVAKDTNPSTCTTGRHEVRLTPVGDDLSYETDNQAAGNPTSRMSKVK